MTKKVDDYHIHEALDRTSLAMNFVEDYLIDTAGINSQEKWKKKAEEAHDALYELYQMIGLEHLK